MTRSSKLFLILAIAAAPLALMTSQSVMAQTQYKAPVTNGYNAVIVDTPNSRFSNVDKGKWREVGKDGARFEFDETGRDEWSVYLRDASRGVTIQLDLWRKKVVYADATQKFDLADITDSQRPVPMPPPPPRQINSPQSYSTNAFTLVGIDTPKGRIFKKSDGMWVEKGHDGGRFEFEETRRDDTIVYLYDRARKVKLRLDLKRRKVVFTDATQSFDLYDITGTSHESQTGSAPYPTRPMTPTPPSYSPVPKSTQTASGINGYNVKRVFLPKGTISLKGNGVWIEKGNDGARFEFEETGRDEWSVYIFDRSRNVRLQLDLHRKKVVYSDATQSYDLYVIEGMES